MAEEYHKFDLKILRVWKQQKIGAQRLAVLFSMRKTKSFAQEFLNQKRAVFGLSHALACRYNARDFKYRTCAQLSSLNPSGQVFEPFPQSFGTCFARNLAGKTEISAMMRVELNSTSHYSRNDMRMS